VDPETERRKRDLRLRIGRLRRRLDARARATQRHAARLASWKTYVRRWPGYAVLAALGLGMSASAGLGGGRWARLLGMRLVRRLGNRAGDRLWQEVRDVWTESAPERQRSEKGDKSNLCEAPGTARRVVGPLRGKLDLSPFSSRHPAETHDG